jgi:hypothetical protein
VIRYTTNADQSAVYAMTLQWPQSGSLTLGAPTTSDTTVVSVLGYDGDVSWKQGDKGGVVVDFNSMDHNKLETKWVWTVKLQNVE